jgi:hypothetical protein
MGEWRYSFLILDFGTRWRLSGQLHVPALSQPEKEFPVPIIEEAGWDPKSIWTL